MNALHAVGEFFFDLIIGDDPKIAAAVLVALALALLALAVGASAAVVTVLGAVAVVVAFTASLLLDTRR